MSGSGTRPSSGSRLSGTDGVRALAAMTILVYHAWLYGPEGDKLQMGFVTQRFFQHLPVAVWLFFVLSGFLLYRPFAAAVMRDRPLPNVRSYLRNRALRILPAYWMILVVVGLVFGAALTRVSPTHVVSGYLDDPLVFAQNALYLQNARPGSLGTGIGPAWTLCVEVVFYLSLPLLALLAFRFGRRASTRAGRRRAVLVPILVLLAIGFAAKGLAAFVVTGPDKSAGWDGDWHSVLLRSFFVHADKLAYGMIVAVARVDWEDGLLRLPRWWRKAAVAAVLLLAAIAIKFTVSDYWWRGELSNYLYDVLATIACALFLALVVLPPPERDARRPLLIRALEGRWMVAVGVASYSVYLWHEPVLRWLHDRDLLVSGAGGFWLNLAFASAIVGALSTLTYRFVEVPALRRKRSMRPAADREPEREPEREGERPVPAYQFQAAP